jgi:gluconate kinase
MRFQNLFFITILIISTIFSGCTKTETPTNANNVKTANVNAATMNTDNPLATIKKPEAATSNNAPTLAPVVQNFYEALNKKDEAVIKKYLSQSALKYSETESKTEKKTLLVYLTETEDPISERREVRNEKFDGETAVAEIKGGSLVNWTPIKFVRENGEWKFASPADSLSLQNIPQTDANSNKVKR